MIEPIDATAWSATLLGLFCIAVATSALRQPGLWRAVVDEVQRSPALQLMSGFIELFVGAVIYLINPWDAGDLLPTIMKAVGGLMMVEALVVTALTDLYFHLWLKNLTALNRGWPLVTLLFGLGLTLAGTMRFA